MIESIMTFFLLIGLASLVCALPGILVTGAVFALWPVVTAWEWLEGLDQRKKVRKP